RARDGRRSERSVALCPHVPGRGARRCGLGTTPGAGPERAGPSGMAGAGRGGGGVHGRVTASAPLRDGGAAPFPLAGAVGVGSRGLRDLDPALLGYLVATMVATFGTTWRVSAFWRRPASAPYARALGAAWREPAHVHTALRAVRRDLVLQAFIARRSRPRRA